MILEEAAHSLFSHIRLQPCGIGLAQVDQAGNARERYRRRRVVGILGREERPGKHTRPSRVEIAPAEATTVRRIFQDYASGQSMKGGVWAREGVCDLCPVFERSPVPDLDRRPGAALPGPRDGTELARLSPLPGGPALDRFALRRRLTEWHGLLRQSPQVARQLLRKLLPGERPIALELTSQGVRFRGRAAWAAVIAGVMQGSGLVVPPG